jgi:hypothetical protein
MNKTFAFLAVSGLASLMASTAMAAPAPADAYENAQACNPKGVVFGEEHNIRYELANDLYDVADSCEAPGPGAESGVIIRLAFIGGAKVAYPILSGSKVALSDLTSKAPHGLSEAGLNGANGGTILVDHSIDGYKNAWSIPASGVPIEMRALPPGTPVAIGFPQPSGN